MLSRRRATKTPNALPALLAWCSAWEREQKPTPAGAKDLPRRLIVQPLEKSMTNRALAKPAEQARRIVDLWQERPIWQRTAEHLVPFYGWLLDHEPAVIPTGPGSILKVGTILAAYLHSRDESRMDSSRVR